MIKRYGKSARAILFPLFDKGHIDKPNGELAEIANCSVNTVIRYKQHWRTTKRREKRGLHEGPFQGRKGNERPWHALAASILRRAVLDLELDKECSAVTCSTSGRYTDCHRCGRSAVEFLRGPLAAFLLDALNLPREKVLRELKL